MFNLSTLGFSRSIATLLEVLELFQNDSHFASIDLSEVSLSHAGQPITVTKYNGRLTVRVAGSLRDVFLAMLDEIDGRYFRPFGRLLEPWEIRPQHWDLLFFHSVYPRSRCTCSHLSRLSRRATRCDRAARAACSSCASQKLTPVSALAAPGQLCADLLT